MKTLNQQFIAGEFVQSHGTGVYAVNSAIRGDQIAEAILGDEVDANRAVDAAKRNDVIDAPFGGFKQSGMGREFGRYGIAAYLENEAVFS